MAKLFALEDADLEGVGEVELEAAPEVGEVADAQTEVVADETEITEVEAGVEEGMGAADQLEQVEEVVEQAAEGEGPGGGAARRPARRNLRHLTGSPGQTEHRGVAAQVQVQAKVAVRHDAARLMGTPRNSRSLRKKPQGPTRARMRRGQDRIASSASVCRCWPAPEGIDKLRAVVHWKVHLS